MSVRAALLAAGSIALAAPVLADQPHLPGNEDIRHVRSFSTPQLSPDGKRVLVALNDDTASGAASHLWVVDLAANTARQLTFSPSGEKRGEKAGRWSADGSTVLFLAKRGDHTQLFRLPMAGGEAEPYDLKVVPQADRSQGPDALPPRTDSPPAKPAEALAIDVESFIPSPDGALIAVLAKDPETPGEKKQSEDKADAVPVDHDPHGTRLYLLDTASKEIKPAAIPANVEKVAWNDAGTQLIAIAEAPNNQSDLGPARGAWRLDVKDPAHPSELSFLPKSVEDGAWSEDGKRFYFLAQAEQDAPPGYRDFYVATLADGAVRNLSGGLAGSVIDTAPLPVSDGAIQAVQIGSRQQVMRFAGGKRDLIKIESSAIRQFATNRARSGWVWLGGGSGTPDKVWFAEKLGQAPKSLPLPSLTPEDWIRTPAKVVRWKNDGIEIDGLLTLPPQAAQGKVPLILLVHGGPAGVWQDNYYPLNDFFLAQGWATLRPNPRGSTGYGAAFVAANQNDLGGGDYRDLMAGVDYVVANYPIDAARLGYYGYSYGGEMAGFVEGKTDRFKAIVSGAPVIDQFSEYGTEDGSWYDRWYYGLPWEHHEDAWRQSALSGVGSAKTPFLLLQGEADTVDPLGQSLEMYRALRQMGVPVEMVHYPRDNHGPLSGAINGNPVPEKWHGFDARQRIARFIQAEFDKARTP
ncbi:MAG TPA: prolyl oligopeptidase family serine peptidase [Magnetospirillaceae bacterium]|nr:prolyl oligopeptidase family serine peptidase [Magnetospirillaceae bacterium]